jgi:hypothetical protein
MIGGVPGDEFVAKAAAGGADWLALARDQLLRAGGPALAGPLANARCAEALRTYAEALRVLTGALAAFAGTIPQAIDLSKASLAYARAFSDLTETVQLLLLDQARGAAQ